MGSFGEHLRREREMHGVSLDQIVASTKISRRLLTALEEEQFDLLPGGIFNKSYVRAFAKCVGMNEDEAVAEYLAAAQETPPDTKVIAHQHAFHGDYHPERSSFPVMPVLVLLVVAAGALGGWKLYQQHRRSRDQVTTPAAETSTTPPVTANIAANPTSSATATPNTAPVTPVASANQPPAEKPVSASTETSRTPQPTTVNTAADGPFEITIRPTGPAWVSVKSDGIYVVRGIIKPPDVKTIHAGGQVVFFTGNAGAVDVTFNGKSVPLNGGSNTEQTLVFTAKGLMPKAATQ